MVYYWCVIEIFIDTEYNANNFSSDYQLWGAKSEGVWNSEYTKETPWSSNAHNFYLLLHLSYVFQNFFRTFYLSSNAELIFLWS